jgi:hypothetical protein
MMKFVIRRNEMQQQLLSNVNNRLFWSQSHDRNLQRRRCKKITTPRVVRFEKNLYYSEKMPWPTTYNAGVLGSCKFISLGMAPGASSTIVNCHE